MNKIILILSAVACSWGCASSNIMPDADLRSREGRESPPLKVTSSSNQLHAGEVTASSFLQSNWNKYQENYHPNYAFDGNPATAWVEGQKGDGKGEILNWKTSKLQEASHLKLRIRNGYQKSKKLFLANSTPKDVRVHVQSRSGNEYKIENFELKKEMGWQEIVMPLEPNRGLSGISLEIVSVYPGLTYKDTCISDIETYVTTRVPYDEVSEKAKLARILEWEKARLATAAYFAKKPTDYPFAATDFVMKDDNQEASSPTVAALPYETEEYPHGAEYLKFTERAMKILPSFISRKDIQEMKDLIGIADQMWAQPDWHKLSVSPKVENWAAPDLPRMQPLRGYLPYLRISEIAVFEANKAVGRQVGDSEDGIIVTSNAKLKYFDDDPKKIEYLAYWVKSSGMEREYYEYLDYHLLVYDKKGNLKVAFSWEPKNKDRISKLELKSDANSKINLISLKSISRYEEDYGYTAFLKYSWEAEKATTGIH